MININNVVLDPAIITVLFPVHQIGCSPDRYIVEVLIKECLEKIIILETKNKEEADSLHKSLSDELVKIKNRTNQLFT